jgi:hypothetical protein
VYSVDNDGRIVEQNTYNRRNKREETITGITYDDHENRITQTTIDDDNDKERDSIFYKYNALGLIELEKRFEDNTLDETYQFKYTDDGKITEFIKTKDEDQALDDRETFTYAADGKLFEHIDYSDKNEIERKKYDFRYDADGNWIYLIMVEDGNDYYIFTREIEYYR